MNAVNDEHKENRLNSPSSVSGVTFNENTKQWFIAVVVSLSIATNVLVTALLLHEYRAKGQSDDLKRYDLDFFKQNDWAEMKTRVMVNERMVSIMGTCPKGK